MESPVFSKVEDLIISDTSACRIARSKNYNFLFSKKDGVFVRWGKTMHDDPTWSPYGPEIADIEISTVCSKGCKFCYKGNTIFGRNMSLEKFKQVLGALSYKMIEIETEIGILRVEENTKILLINGNIILAKEITEGMDIDKVLT